MALKLWDYALNLLARREHSKFELHRKLIAKGFLAAEVAPVLQQLAQQGLQSDERFTESYIAMRCRRGFGPRRIRVELQERGITAELSEQFLVDSNVDWVKLAKEVRQKKFGALLPHDLAMQTKEMNYLYYKGFDPYLIKQIFKV